MTDGASSEQRPRRGPGNLAALSMTRLLIALSGLIANLAVLQSLDREAFGLYRLLFSAMALLTPLATLGLQGLLMRRIARDEADLALVVPAARLTFVLSLLSTALLVVFFAWDRPHHPSVWVAAGLAGVTLGTTALGQVVTAAFHGLRRMGLELPGVVAGRLLLAGSHVALAAGGYGLVALSGSRAAAGALGLALLVYSLRRKVPLPDPDPRPMTRLAMESAPYGWTVAFGVVYAQADTVMLGLLTDDVEVARYNAPAVVLLQLAFVAAIFNRAFVPRIARQQDPKEAAEDARLMTRALLAVSLPITLGGAVVAQDLLALLKQGAYGDALGPFLWLLAAIPLRFVSGGLGAVLMATGHQPERARLDGFAALFNVVLNLAVIPGLGATGAAITTLLTDLWLVLTLRWRVRTVMPGYREGWGVLRAVAAAAIMAVGVHALGLLAPSLHVLVRVLLGGALYVPLAWGLRVLRPSELRVLRRV